MIRADRPSTAAFPPRSARAITASIAAILIASVTAAAVALIAASAAHAATVTGRSLTIKDGSVKRVSGAKGGRAAVLRNGGTLRGRIRLPNGAASMTLRVRAPRCAAGSRLRVSSGRRSAKTTLGRRSGWRRQTVRLRLSAGRPTITVRVSLSARAKRCKARIAIDTLVTRPGSQAPGGGGEGGGGGGGGGNATGNVFAGASLWIDPNSPAANQARTWRNSRPGDAAQMDKIASQPTAIWLGEWSGDIRDTVASKVTTIAGAGKLPVFVLYNIPGRDCGSHSGGGAASVAAYRAWIDGVAAGLAGRTAAFILEPDAVANWDCLDATGQAERAGMLSYAVDKLGAAGGHVYIDAGHSNWHPAGEMARRLKESGIARAAGFSLNVSNFQTTASNRAFGAAVSAQVGGKGFVIDTSRNGNGPWDGESYWCNPPGRALGDRPTTSTGDPLVHAYLWVKVPGESDGSCRSGEPPAGQWWPEYALGLAERAAY